MGAATEEDSEFVEFIDPAEIIYEDESAEALPPSYISRGYFTVQISLDSNLTNIA